MLPLPPVTSGTQSMLPRVLGPGRDALPFTLQLQPWLTSARKPHGI